MNGRIEAMKLVRRLRRIGLEIELASGSTHYHVRNPLNGERCSLSFSPSTNRWHQYVKRDLKRIGVRL